MSNGSNQTTPIEPEALLSHGYREWPAVAVESEGMTRFFQKAFGRLYFVNFREWAPIPTVRDHPTYDAQLCCDTASGGYVWATIKEATIEETERRAGLIWAAAGSVCYEENAYA